jgi:tetratricopeptide (TPR) repeat protein
LEKCDQQSGIESKTRLVEQIHAYLRSGDYSRALDLSRGRTAEFPNDAELGQMETHAQDGLKRKAEADRLITQSQELFAQRKSTEAIQVLREAYDLDKNNSLARAILANALVEQANSIVESDWLKAETLTNQALALNPAHPTAKTILGLIVTRKEASSAAEWVAPARKLQSTGDLFAALAWVAEGLAVHPHDLKLLQIQDEIQRDQEARRRQARRGDLDDLRRMEREISGAADVAAKQALAGRIQAVAAKHWTDGEILSIANALLLRLGLVSQDSSSTSPRSKGSTVILHVPRPSGARSVTVAVPASPASPIPASPSTIPAVPVSPSKISSSPVLPGQTPPNAIPPDNVPLDTVSPRRVSPRRVSPSTPPKGISPLSQPLTASPDPQPSQPQAATVPEPFRSVAKPVSRSPELRQPAGAKSTALVFVSVSAAAMVLVAATFFFTRRYYAPPIAKTAAATPVVSAPAFSRPVVPAPSLSPTDSAPATSTPERTAPEPSPPVGGEASDAAAEKVTQDDQLSAETVRNLGTLSVVTGQDGAKVFLNGKLQRQLTHAGQVRLPNLQPKDYVVLISKSGFQNPPPQKISIRGGEQARLIFDLQPQPSLASSRPASLTIQGGAPGTTVFVDQTLVGTIQPDGTLSVSSIAAGERTVELRKERCKPRQFKKHFVAGGTINLAAADVALEAAPGELKISYTPADANVAIAKGNFLKIVSSGVPLSLSPGTYTLTARTAERFTRTSTLEVVAGQSKTLDLSLAPTGMSNWDDLGTWKHEGDSFVRKGGDFVLYGVAPTSGTFVFSAMLAKGHLLRWVVNYTDARNYVLFQMDDNNFYRSVIRNGQKTDEIVVPDKSDKKSFRTLQVRVSPTEIVHLIKHGESWTLLDRWTQTGASLSLGKFGFYLPGNDQLALSSFSHYADLNIR